MNNTQLQQYQQMLNQLHQMTQQQLLQLSEALKMGDVSQLTRLELLEQITFNTEAFRPSKFDAEHVGKLIDAATTGTTNSTVKTATEIVEAIAAGNKPTFTADKKATELALRCVRGDLLHQLAMFKDQHFLALMGLLCDQLAHKTSMTQIVDKVAQQADHLSTSNVGWTVDFLKVCQSRLSGNQEGVRLI